MKKIFYSLILFVSLFVFNERANALQCLYEGNDGEQIVLKQYYSNGLTGKNYVATAKPLNTFEVGKKTVTNENIAFDVYNDVDGFDEWKYTDECPKYLTYLTKTTGDKAYACDYRTDGSCYGKDGKTLKRIKNPYIGKTENNVSLNKMRCTYEHVTDYGYAYSYSIEISINDQYDPTSGGSYTLWKDNSYLYDGNFDSPGINQTLKVPMGTVYLNESYFDNFSIRQFWNEETKAYKCPEVISVTDVFDPLVNPWFTGTLVGDKTYTIHYDGRAEDEHTQQYELQNYASYIDYDTALIDESLSNYTFEEKYCEGTADEFRPGCNPETYFSLIQRKNKISNEISLDFVVNESYFKLPKDVQITVEKQPTGDKEDYTILYTDCFNSDIDKSCKVTDVEFSNSRKLVLDGWSNTQDSTSVEEGMALYNGLQYKKYMCKLSEQLRESDIPNSDLLTTPNLNFYVESKLNNYNITKVNSELCSSWGIATGFKCEDEFCKENLNSFIEDEIIEVKTYCDNVYKKYLKNKDNESFSQRKDECIKFNDFYQDLVKKGFIKDMTSGCDFVTIDLKDKLVFILDLIKIIGPLAAIFLGMLDFVKAVASGDPDKEMKNAFKRLVTRLIAAVLLFIIPLILAFALDMFLGNGEGYNEDNPFCNLVDWSE